MHIMIGCLLEELQTMNKVADGNRDVFFFEDV